MTVYQRISSEATWQDYTPTLGGFSIGNGTMDCRYCRIGDTVFVEDRITFGSTSSYGSSCSLTLPLTTTSGSGNYLFFDGVGSLSGGVGIYRLMWRSQGGAGTVALRMFSSSAAQHSNITSTTPFTWTTGSILTRRGTYETT